VRPRGPHLVELEILRYGLALIILATGAVSCASGRSNTAQAGAPAAEPQPPVIVQPGAPGEATRGISVARATDLSQVQHTEADVKFMQGMIGHHRQAVEMVALVPSRTTNRDFLLLAERIDVSQADEIKMMEQWLRARGHEVPSEHAHHMAGGMMPGMLTPDEMARLTAATGAEFERLFLEGMIKHHEGALTMVRDLFLQPGAGQESEMFAFASDVDADQRMEIQRMSAMLQETRK
jgi:uncharacterized protein (DUF305 family)